MAARTLLIRTREHAGTVLAEPEDVERGWEDARSALVICDLWDATQCVAAARRAALLAPRIDAVASNLRRGGALIVHAPGGCMDFYEGTPARARAMQAPRSESPAPIDWNSWNCDHHAELSRSLIDPGPCSCDAPEPCCTGGPPYPWKRQAAAIEIAADDAVTDDGQELFNLLAERHIEDVIVVGVHTNICVLGRPYGLRQLVFCGRKPLLCRDLTDSYHRDPRGHSWGTDQTVAHIERYWCPTVTSDQFVGGEPFSVDGNTL